MNTTGNAFTDMLVEINAEHDAMEQNTAEQLNAERQRIIDSAPTISSGAMLTCLSIGVWEGKMTDHEASEQITSINHADKNAARVIKNLLGNCPELDAIKKHRGFVRNHIHYALTMPWSNGGLQMLTTQAYMGTPTVAGYRARMEEAEAEFWRLVDEFCDAYDWKVAEAKLKLGDMFNQNNYPSRDEVRHKFKFSVEYIPLPEAGDFRVDMAQETIQHLTEGYEKFYSDEFTKAMRSIWQKLYKPLANMVDRLDYADYNDKETRKIFGSGIVDNVLNIVDLMGLVNITGDSTMTKIEQDLRAALNGVTAEALREDNYLRARTHKAAAEALKDVKEQIDNLPSIW